MKIQTILAASVAAVSLLVSSAVLASSYTGNVGVNSNYIWRGVTQSNDLSAVSGGIDWSHPSGAYVGGWTSSLGGGDYEFDLYGGYGFTAGTVDLDVGIINYQYPTTGNANDPLTFTETYVNATMKNFTVGVNITISKDGTEKDNDLYVYGTGDFELKKDLTLSVTVGSYSFDDTANNENYTHVQASLSKDEFSFTFDKNDTDFGDEVRLSVGYSKSIDF